MKANKSEKELKRFLNYYSVCPVCNRENDEEILTAFFLSKERENRKLKNNLLSLMKENKDITGQIKVGVPCCSCLTKVKPPPPPAILPRPSINWRERRKKKKTWKFLKKHLRKIYHQFWEKKCIESTIPKYNFIEESMEIRWETDDFKILISPADRNELISVLIEDRTGLYLKGTLSKKLILGTATLCLKQF